MLSTSDIKNGLSIILNGEPWMVIGFLHVKPGKGQAYVRTNLKNLKNGKVIEHTFKVGESIEEAKVEYKKMQYLYADEDNFYFMDSNFEQYFLTKEQIGNLRNYLVDSVEVDGVFIDGKFVSIKLPPKLTFKVIYAPPGIKGDSATSARKTVRIETGYELRTPLFINEGDEIIINTETGEYVSRA